MTLIRRTNGLFPSVPSFFDDFFTKDVYGWSNSNLAQGASLPAVNVKEDENAFEVEVAVPGMKKEDFKIEIDNDVLTVSSEKEVKPETEDNTFKRREFHYASFKRTFSLPENTVNSDKIKAEYVDGVLHISLPKRDEVKPKPVRLINVG